MNKFINIAIDGPAGSGKSTIAKKLSEKLGFFHLNTGSMYRTMALYFVEKNLDFENEEVVKNNAQNILLEVKFENGEQSDYLNGRYVTHLLREEKVTYASSFISQFACIREIAVKQQQSVASRMNVIMEGRDIGTKVLPNANYKFFLTASPEERARRRLNQIISSGGTAEYDEVLNEIKQRDERDLTREMSPLVQADDAILVDSDNMNVEQVVEFIISKINL